MITPKQFFKSTEAIVVLGGLFTTVTLGKGWAIATGIAYVAVNLISWAKAELDK